MSHWLQNVVTESKVKKNLSPIGKERKATPITPVEANTQFPNVTVRLEIRMF